MIITTPAALANQLRENRKTRDMSQAEVASRVGLKQNTVSAFENKPANTKIETLFKLLAALDLELHVVARGGTSEGAQWNKEW